MNSPTFPLALPTHRLLAPKLRIPSAKFLTPYVTMTYEVSKEAYEKYPRLALFTGIALLFFVFSLATVTLTSFIGTANAASRGAAAASAASNPAASATMELHIANNGLTLLRGAKVLSISGNKIVVSTQFGAVEFKWVVISDAVSYNNHTAGTKFLSSTGQPRSIEDIHEGDLLTISGMLDESAHTPTLTADDVRLTSK